MTAPQDWMARAAYGLAALRGAAVMAAVRQEVDAFFAAQPGTVRDAEAEQIIAILVFERLTLASSPLDQGAATPGQAQKQAA